MPFRNTIKKVEVYQIKDKYFETLNEAKDSVVDSVCEVIDKRLNKILQERNVVLSRNDIFKIVMLLAGDYDKVTELIKDLNNVYHEVEEDYDDSPF